MLGEEIETFRNFLQGVDTKESFGYVWPTDRNITKWSTSLDRKSGYAEQTYSNIKKWSIGLDRKVEHNRARERNVGKRSSRLYMKSLKILDQL